MINDFLFDKIKGVSNDSCRNIITQLNTNFNASIKEKKKKKNKQIF